MSGKYLGPADRQVIAQEWAAYSSVAAIADKVGVAKKTRWYPWRQWRR